MEAPLNLTNKSKLILEVMRQAELRLDAQLTAAIASDARAMQFLSFIAAITVLLISAAIAALEFSEFAIQGFIVAIVGALGFVVAGFYAFQAAKPVLFEFSGGYPSAWQEDIEADIPLDDALRQQLSLYERRLNANRESMAQSSEALKTAARYVVATLIVAGSLTFAFAVAHAVASLPSA